LKIRSRITSVVFGVIGVMGVALIWTAFSLGDTGNARFPSLPKIFDAINDNFFNSAILAYNTFGEGGIFSNLMWTAGNVLISVSVGVILGYVVGILLVRLQWFRNLSSLPIAILGTIPVLVMLPFLTLWFGDSRFAMGGMVIFYTALTITEAVRSSSAHTLGRWGDYAASLGVSGTRVTLSVLLPASLPASLGTLRAAMAFGWGFQAVAEVLGGSNGAGRLIRTFADSTNTAGVIGTLLCVGILAVLVDAIVATVGRWATRWNE